MAQKKSGVFASLEEREQEALIEAKEIIASRMPRTGGVCSFKLIGKHRMMKPKFTYVASNGFKLKIRYSKYLNSIFEYEQQLNGDDVVELNMITLNENNTIRDNVLTEFLLLNPKFDKAYKLIDPVGAAERELETFMKTDRVWDDVKDMPIKKLQSLVLLLEPNNNISSVSGMKEPQLLLKMRRITESSPDLVKDAIVNPQLDTLYLSHSAFGYKYVRINKNSGSIVWADTGKEICKVPADKDAAKVLSSMLLLDEYSSIRDILETKING